MFRICDMCTDVTYAATQLETLVGLGVHCRSMERQLLAHASLELYRIQNSLNICGTYQVLIVDKSTK